MITKLHQRAGLLRFRDLELVRVLATTGSLRRAAAVLGLSQPMLSRRLRDIEHIMGTVLWARSRKGLEVTAAGERFIAWAEALLNEMAQARRDIQAPRATPIRIGAPPDLVLKFTPRVLSALPHQHARVSESMLPSCWPDCNAASSTQSSPIVRSMARPATSLEWSRCFIRNSSSSRLPVLPLPIHWRH
jgi:molybdenum-dependent DNA-binding transcriptional regulator ModE